jgi:type II secretory pathway component PulJ
MKPAIHRSRTCHGFTLIECLVYIAMLAMIGGLTYLTFYRTRDNSRDLGRNADDVARTLQAGERWREDVRQASGRLQLSQVEGVPQLRIPQAQGEVIYFFRESEVVRQAAGHTAPVLTKVKNSTMLADAREKVAAWRWEVELLGRPDRTRIRPLFSFQAVALAEQTK